MKDAQYFLVVRFSVEPQAEAQLMRWLDGGHVKEVVGQKGFLWCKRLRLGAHEFVEKHMRIERFTGELEASYAAA